MFGRTSPTTAAHVEKEFAGKVLVLDGGPCEFGIESTVVDFTINGSIKIIRPGLITAKMFQAVSDALGLGLKVTTASQKNSPGTLRNHYQPSIPLVLVDSALNLTPQSIAVRAGKMLQIEPEGLVQLVLPENPQFAARSLYAGLRELEQTGATMIYFVFDEHNQQGEWGAIWDRLWRAATAEFVSYEG
jgi:L-threonylcarbamoyladenylate synthase